MPNRFLVVASIALKVVKIIAKVPLSVSRRASRVLLGFVSNCERSQAEGSCKLSQSGSSLCMVNAKALSCSDR
jgi:hypothetical protein